MTLSVWVMDVSLCWQWCELSICLSPGYWRRSEWLISGVPGHIWVFTLVPPCFFPLWILLCMSREIWDNQSHDYILRQIKWLSPRISPHCRCQWYPSVSELAALGSPLVTGGKSGLIHLHWIKYQHLHEVTPFIKVWDPLLTPETACKTCCSIDGYAAENLHWWVMHPALGESEICILRSDKITCSVIQT